MPITLKNINSNVDIGGVGRTLSQATQIFDNSLKNLQKTAYNVEIDRDKKAIEAFRNSIAGASANDLANFDIANADQNSRLGAAQLKSIVDKRLTSQRASDVSAFNANEATRKQREAPLIATARNLAVSNKPEELQKFLSENSIQDTAQFTQLLRQTQNSALNQQRANEQYNISKDTRLNGQKLNNLGRDLLAKNIAAESTIREQQQNFASKMAGMVQFDNSGNLSYDPSLTPEQRVAIGKEYEQLTKSFPKILSNNDITKQVAEIAKNLGASFTQEQSVINAISQRNKQRNTLSPEMQQQLAEADKESIDKLNSFKVSTQQAVDAVKEQEGWTPTIGQQLEEDKSIQSGAFGLALNKIFTDTALNKNLDTNERRNIIEALDTYNKTAKVPEAVQVRALNAVGLFGIFQGSGVWWLNDKESIQRYKDEVVKQKAEYERRLRIDEAVAKAQANKFKQDKKEADKIAKIIKGHTKQAKSQSGVFNPVNTKFSAPTLPNEINKINALNNTINTKNQDGVNLVTPDPQQERAYYDKLDAIKNIDKVSEKTQATKMREAFLKQFSG